MREKPSERLARLVRASRPCARCGAPAVARIERADELAGSDRHRVWSAELVCRRHYEAAVAGLPAGLDRRNVTWLD